MMGGWRRAQTGIASAAEVAATILKPDICLRHYINPWRAVAAWSAAAVTFLLTVFKKRRVAKALRRNRLSS
jgi:hypothetical protein